MHEAWEAQVMASKKEQKAFEEVAGIIGDLLRQAVAATISDPAPEPARWLGAVRL